MRTPILVPLLAIATLVGCANRPDSTAAEIRAAMQPYEDLKQQKAELWELGFEPQEFEFEGQGKVTVTNWSLTGWPGEVYVNAEIRYENTTDEPVTHAIVWLEVLDADGNVVGSTAQRLFNPLGYSMWPGTFHSGAKLRAPTNDVHLDPRGWQWGIACTALHDDDPGTKPVLIIGPEDQRVRGFGSSTPRSTRNTSRGYSRPTQRPAQPGYSYWESQGVQNYR
ncbi:MAG: FxLYD domain-containing protein [Planctomycetes bacterium]|nr:FxLYD domain-containing protein [Planctomycetota bacterium]